MATRTRLITEVSPLVASRVVTDLASYIEVGGNAIVEILPCMKLKLPSWPSAEGLSASGSCIQLPLNPLHRGMVSIMLITEVSKTAMTHPARSRRQMRNGSGARSICG